MTASATGLRRPGSIVLISCYELGHQPLGIASAAALLQERGFSPSLLDLSRQSLEPAAVQGAGLIAVCAPMHTALVLGIQAAQRIRPLAPDAHLCFFGLYAALNRDLLLESAADSVIGGEGGDALVELAEALERGESGVPGVSLPGRPSPPRLARPRNLKPAREALPPLSEYARLEADGETRLVGYVASTVGCKHRCLHCPIPPVYGGRFFALPRDAVLDDIRFLVDSGARHITFGDPDFLNGPGHALPIVRGLHREFPALTYDFTAKIEHLLRHRDLLREFAETGCLFIVSAVESLSGAVLANLEKGHTRADVEAALELTRNAGIVLRPTFVPFTPWSTLEDYRELLEFVRREGLVRHVDPIQFAIRLLVPPGSALLGTPQFEPFQGDLDRAALSYRWIHPDPQMDALQGAVMGIVETASSREWAPERTFVAIQEAAWTTSGTVGGTADPPPFTFPLVPGEPVPRLTEAWFC